MAHLPLKDIPTQALVVQQAGSPFVLQDLVLDELQPQELLVEIKYVGVCHTDLVVQQGHMPLVGFPTVLGHEGSGTIRRLGPGLEDAGLSEGDNVILGYCSCRSCPPCKEGRKGACETISVVNFGGTRSAQSPPAIRTLKGGKVHGAFFGQSSFSRLAIVDSRAVVKFDGDPESLASLAPLGCGYLTGAATVMEVLKPRAAGSLVVLGLGAVGLTAIMAAKHEKVTTIVAVDIVDSRLQLASRFGATDVVNSKNHKSIESAVRDILPKGAEYVIDATGVTGVMESGIRCLAHGGKFAVVGMAQPDQFIKVQPLSMLTQCHTIVGVTGGFCDPQTFIPRLVDMYKAGEFPVDELQKTYSASEIQQAVEDMKSGKVVKPVLSW